MDPSFFARFGLYVATDLLDENTCRGVRDAMDEAQQVEATVEDEGKYEVDRSHRKTRLAKVDPKTLALVSDRLNSLRETLSGHFDLELEECEKPQFLVYEDGDFFRDATPSAGRSRGDVPLRTWSAMNLRHQTPGGSPRSPA